MITTRNFFILTPTWTLVKDLYIENNNTWAPVKQAYIKRNGIWNQIYAENAATPSPIQHPYWQYTLDSEFRVNDNNQNDGLATDLFYTFWSTGNSGTYAINQGSARININSIDTTFTPAVPPTDPVTNFTTETRSIFCNFTANSSTVVTFSDPGVSPVTRTGVDGVSVPWNIQAFGYTRSGTTITGISSTTPPTQTFTMSQTAQNFSPSPANGITANLSRTYASSITPGTPGSPAFYTHYGITRMLSNYELKVTGNQNYRLSTSAFGGTISSTTRWGLNAYTSPNAGQANPFGTGAVAFQSPTYGGNTAQTFDINVPSGHQWLRVGIFMEHNSTTSTNSPPSVPQWGRFDYLRVTRII